MAYSQFFSPAASGTIAKPRIETSQVYNPLSTQGRTTQQRVVASGGGGLSEWAGGKKDDSASRLDQAMSGLDAKAGEYEQILRGVYDNYSGSVDKYAGDIEGLLDAMDGDIAKLTGYIGDYENVLAEIKPDFMNGIKVEESDGQRRATYMGNVAQQYANSEQAQNREMAAQGINPYANSGNRRANLLNRNAAMAGAGNQAYGDWLTAHNQQVQADQGAKATYAGLAAKPAELQSGVVNARGGMTGIYSDLINQGLEADKAKAAGYQYLNDVNSGRRSETLQLAQNKQQSDTNRILNQQSVDLQNAELKMKMEEANKSVYDPSYKK